MKVTRSYWLGLSSGFILSAMLALVISPLSGQALSLQNPNPLQTPQNSQTQENQSSTSTMTPPNTFSNSSAAQTVQGPPLNPQNASKIEQNFVIPHGSSSERIADLLVAQGLIKDKVAFLQKAHQMGVESKFRSGTFNLSLGLTPEELINRLVKN